MNNNTSVMNIHDSNCACHSLCTEPLTEVNLLLREERFVLGKIMQFYYINVAFAHHGYIKNTVKTVILWNIIAI